MMTKNTSNNYLKIFLSIIFILIFSCLVKLYVDSENYIYFWDYSGYWNRYVFLSKAENIVEGIKQTVSSIPNDDYNLLPVLPLMLPKILFGTSRFGYIESILLIYYLPSVLLMLLLFKKLLIKYYDVKNTHVYNLLLFAIPPIFLGPMLRGYLDVVVVIPLIFLLSMIFKFIDGSEKVRDYLTIGLLLLFGSLLRRWFVIWSVSYFISLVLLILILRLSGKKNTFNNIFIDFSRLLIIPLTFLLGTVIFKPTYIQLMYTSYIVTFSNYKHTASFFTKVVEQISNIGLIYFIFAFLGIIASIYNRKSRLFGIFLVFLVLCSFTIFINVQDISDHHAYFYVPILIVFSWLGIFKIFSVLKIKTKYALALSLIFFSSLLYIKVFVNKPVFAKDSWMFPKINYFPLVRNDIQNIDSLLYRLNEIQGKDFIYILSSSQLLNSDIVVNRASHLGYGLNLLQTAEVDSRDGFYSNFFLAKYIVLTKPAEYHLGKNYQKNINFPYNFVVDNNEYFTIINSYLLDNGYHALIYTKIKEIPDTVIENMRNEYEFNCK